MSFFYDHAENFFFFTFREAKISLYNCQGMSTTAEARYGLFLAHL